MKIFKTEAQLTHARQEVTYMKMLLAEATEPKRKPSPCTALTHKWDLYPHFTDTKVCTVCGCMTAILAGELHGLPSSTPVKSTYQWFDERGRDPDSVAGE